MSGSVKKVFMVLITIVACVVIGAFILNIAAPNVITQTSNAIEGMVYNATKISIDINGDGRNGQANASGTYTSPVQGSGDASNQGVGVNGFE